MLKVLAVLVSQERRVNQGRGVLWVPLEGQVQRETQETQDRMENLEKLVHRGQWDLVVRMEKRERKEMMVLRVNPEHQEVLESEV